MEQIDTNILKNKVSTLIVNKSSVMNRETMIHSSVPIPRDGHSCCQFENYLIIFGGDRNKFPLNDLFRFNLTNN